MGTNNLAARSGGQTVEADDVNQYRNALIGSSVPRNSSGSAETLTGSLGSPSLEWDNIYLGGSIVQAGSVLDFSQVAGEANRILSGEEETSGYPAFLTFIGATTTGRIFAANTDLALVVNTTSVTLNSNIDITGLAVAPSSNNTALINDITLTGAAASRVYGEAGEPLIVDTVGTAISALKGTVQAFLKGSEYFYAFIDTDNNRIFPLRRGVARSTREVLTDNDTLTLLSASWIFIDADGLNTYASTIFPSYLSEDPAGVSNQFYFNTTTKRWRRYSGSWANIDAHLLGSVILNDTACVAADPADFDLRWNETLEGTLSIDTVTKVRVHVKAGSVAGVAHIDDKYGQVIDLSVAGDRESGVSEAADTRFYIYADRNLKFRFSDKPPRNWDRKLGQYHPSEYWRYIGYADNNSASDINAVKWDNGKTRAEPDPILGWEYLGSSGAISAAATVDFTTAAWFTDTYSKIAFEFFNVKPANNAVNFLLTASIDGGATYLAGTSYEYAFTGRETSGGAIGGQSGGTTSLSLNGGVTIGNDTNEHYTGTLSISKVYEATTFKEVSVDAAFRNGSTLFHMNKGGGAVKTTSAINAIRFLMSTGNIASGEIQVFGLRVKE